VFSANLFRVLLYRPVITALPPYKATESDRFLINSISSHLISSHYCSPVIQLPSLCSFCFQSFHCKHCYPCSSSARILLTRKCKWNRCLCKSVVLVLRSSEINSQWGEYYWYSHIYRRDVTIWYASPANWRNDHPLIVTQATFQLINGGRGGGPSGFAREAKVDTTHFR
jgi:hypothetical protein